MRIFVAGSAGQLGRAVVGRFSPRMDVVATTRRELDIRVEADVMRAVRAAAPDVVVNCTAYNAVDQAEEDPGAALESNAFGVLALARAARDTGAVFIHYSTDFVFDGRASVPYTETDAPAPASHYGLSKLLGEWLAAEAPLHYILRVESLFGGELARSSVDRILEGIRKDEIVRVFVDRTVTPSYVDDVADATLRIIEGRPECGLYHCVNTGVTTWLGIATEAARLLGRKASFEEMSVDSVQLRARRPKYCALSNDKLRHAGIGMPSWQDALSRYVRKG